MPACAVSRKNVPIVFVEELRSVWRLSIFLDVGYDRGVPKHTHNEAPFLDRVWVDAVLVRIEIAFHIGNEFPFGERSCANTDPVIGQILRYGGIVLLFGAAVSASIWRSAKSSLLPCDGPLRRNQASPPKQAASCFSWLPPANNSAHITANN